MAQWRRPAPGEGAPAKVRAGCRSGAKIGAKVVSHAKAVTFQMEEVAVPGTLFAAILDRIGRLRVVPGTA